LAQSKQVAFSLFLLEMRDVLWTKSPLEISNARSTPVDTIRKKEIGLKSPPVYE